MAHEVMRVVSASPFHTVSRVEVYISADPADQQVFQVGSKKIGNTWEKVFSLSKIGIDKLLSAAGVECLNSVGQEIADRIWVHQFTGKYVKPDGTPFIDMKQKTIDLRVGGTRWTKEKEKHLDRLTIDWAKKANFNKRGGESTEDYAIRIQRHMEGSFPVELEELSYIAGEKATRFVNQAAQFGAELAESGSVERFARSLFQLGKYTEEQLDEPFVIWRSRFEWAKVQARFGDEIADRLLLASVQKELGVELQLPETVEPTINGNPFAYGILSGTAEYLLGTDWAEQGSRTLFDKDLTELTEGEAQLMITYKEQYDGMASRDDLSEDDKGLLKEHFLTRIRICAEEARMWDDVIDGQLEMDIESTD